MSGISLHNLSKKFPDGTEALQGIDLDIKDGEFLVLVGPSGCGKTTLLRIIAGLESPTTGTIEINNKEVNQIPPKDRDLGMVFQNYALFPHLDVYENIAFGLKAKKYDRQTIERKVSPVADKLGLSDQLRKKPDQLSGGQRQRVALGRLLARNPSIHLLDEPLSNLDASLRLAMRGQLAELHEEYQKTTVFVTHDQIEAMTLGQRLCVMNKGKIIQIGSPDTIYQKPSHRFVAEFFGFPTINFFEGNILTGKQGLCYEIASKTQLVLPNIINHSEGRIDLGVRPEDWVIQKEAFQNSIEVGLTRVENLGDTRILHLEMDNQSISIKSQENNFTIGQSFYISPNWDRIHWFNPVNGNRISM
jgi:multiple sugar transport system ATP-binding protein